MAIPSYRNIYTDVTFYVYSPDVIHKEFGRKYDGMPFLVATIKSGMLDKNILERIANLFVNPQTYDELRALGIQILTPVPTYDFRVTCVQVKATKVSGASETALYTSEDIYSKQEVQQMMTSTRMEYELYRNFNDKSLKDRVTSWMKLRKE